MLRPKLSLNIGNDPTPDELLFARQLGVECVYTWVEPEQRSVNYLTDLRRRVEDAGLILWNAGSYDAEEAGVRMALHPNDPPATGKLGGIPCLIHSFETYKRAFAVANSPALGMEFCTGCWLEGGPASGDLLEGIRTFHADNRILLVHFRNVTSPLPHFLETFLDNGYMEE